MPSRTLDRVLGLRDLILIVIGTVIGSGVFLVPGGVLRQSGGNAGPALLVWVIGGVLSLLGALAYGELGAMNPAAGGLYVYLRVALGPLTAFLYGWTFFLVIATGSAATLAVASTSYLQQFITLGPDRSEAGGRRAARDRRRDQRAQHTAQRRRSELEHGIKVGALLVMSTVLVASHGAPPSSVPFWPESVTTSLVSGMGLGMIGVLWAYEGWQYVTFSAGEAMNPQRTFPRAIVLGTASLIGIYLFANVGYLAALGTEGVARSDRVAAEAVGAIVGPGAAKLIAAAILVSIFSAMNGITISAPRVYYAMARDGLFFQQARRRAPAIRHAGGQHHRGHASGRWCSRLSGTFEQLLTYVVFVGWIFYALGAACVFVLRRTQPDAERPFRVPGYPWTPLLFIVAAVALVLNTIATQPGRAAIGIGVVLLGLPVYFLWRRRT